MNLLSGIDVTDISVTENKIFKKLLNISTAQSKLILKFYALARFREQDISNHHLTSVINVKSTFRGLSSSISLLYRSTRPRETEDSSSTRECRFPLSKILHSTSSNCILAQKHSLFSEA